MCLGPNGPAPAPSVETSSCQSASATERSPAPMLDQQSSPPVHGTENGTGGRTGRSTSSRSGRSNSYPFHYDAPSIAPDNAREIVIQAACKLKVEAEFGARFVAVPNGTYTASRYARVTRAKEGLAKGFPDAIIVGTGRNRGRTAFAEIKAKGSLSEWQLAWLTALHEDGHDCGLFRSDQTLADWLRQRGWW